MAKGLPSVTQLFLADNSDYLQKLNQNRDAIAGEVQSLREHQAAVERNQAVVEKFANELGEVQRKLIAAKRAQDEYSNAIMSGDAMGQALDRMERINVALDQVKAKTEEINRAGSGDRLGAAADKASASYAKLNREAADFIANLRTQAGFANQAAQHEITAAAAEKQIAAYQALKKETAGYYSMLDGFQRSADLRGTSIRTMGDNALYTNTHLREMTGLLNGLTAAQRVDTFPGQVGDGGGGGGGGGFLAGLAGGGMAGKIFGGALPGVQAVHMITMFTMEALSTIIPAAVAAGAAGAVGIQAGQNIVGRGQSMFNAAEALGPTYGTSFGKMIGMGSGFQQAQNQATGGVYGIAGGLRQLAGQGQGAFSGMGVQTIAMIDQGIASMVLHNRVGAVTNALAGGTGYLRSFGDIAANIGDTLLNLAPNLPGMGQILLGGLKGATGLASFLTGHVPGIALGGGLAAEAGFRWGGLALSGGQLPGWLGGGAFGGLAGVAERFGLGKTAKTAAADAAKFGLKMTPGFAADFGGGTGLAGFLGEAGGGPTMLAALAAFGISQIMSHNTAQTNQLRGLQAGINQSFGAGAWQPVTKALYQAPIDIARTQAQQNIHDFQLAGAHGGGLLWKEQQNTAAQVASFSTQLGSLVAEGPAVQKALAGIGDHGASLSDAFAAATMAMIPLKDMAGGQLNAQGKQLLKQWQSAYDTMATGGTGAAALIQAGAANYIMSSEPMKKLATINQGLDSMTQIMTGGPLAASQLVALGGAARGSPFGAGLRTTLGAILNPLTAAQAAAGGTQQPATTAQVAQALTGFFTPKSAAAWAGFTGTANAPGIISTLQQNMDQIRTYQTLGAMTGAGGTGLGAFYLQQQLGYASKSPAALAMLQQQGMQANIPGLAMGQSFKDTAKAVNAAADNMNQANAAMTQAVKQSANIPATAMNLLAPPGGGPSALGTALAAQTAQAALAAGGHPTAANVAALQSSLTMGGVKPGQMKVGVDAILQGLHVPGNIIAKVNGELTGIKPPPGGAPPMKIKGEVDVKPGSGALHMPPMKIPATVDVKPPAAMPKLPASHLAAIDVPVNYKVNAPPEKKYPSQSPNINYILHAPGAPNYPNMSRTITYYLRTVGSVSGAIGSVGGTTSGGGRYGQKGMLIPGYGGGDIVPAMLEPGELVVPKHLVPSVSPILSGRIPGFAAGGIAGVNVPDIPGLGTNIRIAMQSGFNQMTGNLNNFLGALTGGPPTVAAGSGGGGGGFIQNPTPAQWAWINAGRHGPMPGAGATVAGSTATAHHVAAVTGAHLIAAFEKTFKGMGPEFGKLAAQILQGLLAGVKNAPHESAKVAQAIISKVTQEINYGKSVASASNAIAQFGTFGTGLATPTMTAQGKPYQYYADQQTIAGGGTVSVQQNMSDYLQTMQSFQGDIGKLSKAGINKQMLQSIISQGPLQGDAMAQSILGGGGGYAGVSGPSGMMGPGGVKGANQLWNQINAMSKSLGITAGQGVYGYGMGAAAAHGKMVDIKTSAPVGPVHQLQSAINSLHGKTVTIKVNVVEASGGGGIGTGGKLSKAETKFAMQQVQKGLLQQAKRTGSTNVALPKPYGI